MSKLIDLKGPKMEHWLACAQSNNGKTRWLCECHCNRLCNRGCMAAPDVRSTELRQLRQLPRT
jgi:hypothetical protein